jgi:hypothetical protein
MIEVKEETDGSLTISWDENDPVESQLNTWTEQDFINSIMDKCKELEDNQNSLVSDVEVTTEPTR